MEPAKRENSQTTTKESAEHPVRTKSFAELRKEREAKRIVKR
jgi:hypothetical protein